MKSILIVFKKPDGEAKSVDPFWRDFIAKTEGVKGASNAGEGVWLIPQKNWLAIASALLIEATKAKRMIDGGDKKEKIAPITYRTLLINEHSEWSDEAPAVVKL